MGEGCVLHPNVIWPAEVNLAKVTLDIDYKSGDVKEYANAYVAISPAGVLTFYWRAEDKGSKKSRAYKFTTSVPFAVEEDIAAS